MSTDIQAPDLNNGEEKEESHVEISEDTDTVKHTHGDLGSHKVIAVSQRSHCRFTATASILGVLYLLILAGVFMRYEHLLFILSYQALYILVTLEKLNLETERDQLNVSLNEAQIRNINLTQERDELQTRYDDLSRNYAKLEKDRDMCRSIERERDYWPHCRWPLF
ncbi:uncharacterized protein AKAME5_002661500 [Lates japonicus]|uniref:Uncharacterized protein n=1 Tax=Lates japonicus TaxID=270547 RepID=A0AAD3NLT9_LATJO|nr:uncharacterized protein AKAME5_002661500 [Lates japonicus]